MEELYETPDGKIYKLSDLKKVVSFKSSENFTFKSQQLLTEWNDLVEEFDTLLSKFVTDEEAVPSLENFYKFFNQVSGNNVIYGMIDARIRVDYLYYDNESYRVRDSEEKIRYDHKVLLFYGSIKNALQALVNQVVHIDQTTRYVFSTNVERFQIKEIRLTHLDQDNEQEILESWFDAEKKLI